MKQQTANQTNKHSELRQTKLDNKQANKQTKLTKENQIEQQAIKQTSKHNVN